MTFNRENAQKTFVTVVIAAILSVFIFGLELKSVLPYVPVMEASGAAIDWLENNFTPFFDAISWMIKGLLAPIEYVLLSLPQSILISAFALLGYLLGKTRLFAFVTAALLLISSMGFWEPAMQTLSLVLSSTILALLVGIPLGVVKAHVKWFSQVLDPVLDFMQTMPLFVYLIPAVLFFSIGNVPGIVATFIFAVPPAIRLTSLGIEQIPHNTKEAGWAFGANRWQFITKVELPLAAPSILAGINQTIMLSLSMVVVASMIGAEGLGQEVLRGITRLNVGQGIASGLGIVLLAMILDRMTKKVWLSAKSSN